MVERTNPSHRHKLSPRADAAPPTACRSPALAALTRRRRRGGATGSVITAAVLGDAVTRIETDVTEAEAGELLAELVRRDSTNPPGRERACAEFIHGWLADAGVEADLVAEPFPDRPQVVAEVGDGDPEAGTLVLNGHVDVVPPGPAEDWSRDPFGGEIADGKVYGRGASDMKSGLAATMLAARAAADSDAVDGRLLLQFAVGEEMAEPGTRTLVEGLDADYGIVLEPTELVVDTAAKGLAWYEVDVRGESCHASRPSVGRNALDGLLAAESALSAYRAEIADRTHDLLGESLCTPTVARAGEKENVVPSSATLTLDRRFLPSESPAELDREVDAAFDGVRERGFDVDVERTRTYEAAEIPTDAPVAEAVRRHAADVAGVDTAPHGKVAATDQRNLVNDAGVPTVVWGPGTPAQSHTADEWARTDLLVDAVEVLCRVVDDLCVND
jgi:succinyl-diaminopimelate desuccinylase